MRDSHKNSTVLAVERHRRIVEAVNRSTSLRVTELAMMFGVTEETIRRDLEKLRADGLIVRSHGGAVSVTDISNETHYTARETEHLAEKAAIAREAVKRVHPDDTIMMDSSSTVLQMAKLIPDMRITVLTNSIRTAMELSSRPQVRVIAVGGTLMSSSLSFVGPLAEKCLEDYHVDKMFFSCKGFSPGEGLSESNELQALLKGKMIGRADKRYLLVDSSKLGRKSLSVWAQAGEVTELITDAGASAENLAGLQKIGVKITRAA